VQNYNFFLTYAIAKQEKIIAKGNFYAFFVQIEAISAGKRGC